MMPSNIVVKFFVKTRENVYNVHMSQSQVNMYKAIFIPKIFVSGSHSEGI